MTSHTGTDPSLIVCIKEVVAEANAMAERARKLQSSMLFSGAAVLNTSRVLFLPFVMTQVQVMHIHSVGCTVVILASKEIAVSQPSLILTNTIACKHM